MNIAELWAEIEREHTWRDEELRFFHNQIASLPEEDERRLFRKALVLLLYAHFEGFCKFALAHYVRAVNSEGILCSQADAAVVAASLSQVFKELRNPNSKAKEFRNELPDDAKLHAFAREREFVQRSVDFESKPVSIPDDIIDTESNLKPVVLRKNLYKIGLAHDRFATLDGQINKLLNLRNNIAHGSATAGIEQDVYEELRSDVTRIIKGIKGDIMAALSSKAYLRDV